MFGLEVPTGTVTQWNPGSAIFSVSGGVVINNILYTGNRPALQFAPNFGSPNVATATANLIAFFSVSSVAPMVVSLPSITQTLSNITAASLVVILMDSAVQ